MAKKTRRNYTPEQKLELVTEIERRYRAGEGSLATLAKKLGTSESNYHNWLRAGIRPKKPAPPRQYSPDERERLRASVDHFRVQGLSLDAACKAVGIAETSYRKWKDDATPMTLRPVEITALVPVAPAPSDVRESLTLVSPAGYRLEGLGVETAAALLRALA